MRIQPGRTPNRKSGVTPGGFPLLRRVGDAAAPLIDVIFVHGLGGDTRSTWQAASSLDCMLDWIAEDCPAAQVWSLDYPAVTTRWTDRGRGMALPRRARGLIELLLQLGIGERGLVFVCHSLGGLVVKQILRHSRELSAPGWEDIANSVLGVVFIATPHGGSSLASFAKAAIVTRPSASTLALTANCPHLEDLALWYRQNAGGLGIETAAYAETLPMPGGVIVVNLTSADPAVPGCMAIPLDADHIGICKPNERQVPPYPGIKAFIDRQVGRAREARPAEDDDQSRGLVPANEFLVQAPGGLVEASGSRALLPAPVLDVPVRGRDRVIESFARLASAPDGRVHVLTGLGGAGKSTAARAMADRIAADGGRVWWVHAGSAVVGDAASAGSGRRTGRVAVARWRMPWPGW